jgi:hypothetical protein
MGRLTTHGGRRKSCAMPVWQRVRIGPIASVPEYDQLIARLSALGYPGARLAQD